MSKVKVEILLIQNKLLITGSRFTIYIDRNDKVKDRILRLLLTKLRLIHIGLCHVGKLRFECESEDLLLFKGLEVADSKRLKRVIQTSDDLEHIKSVLLAEYISNNLEE